MSASTWTWVGGTINVDSPVDWSLTSGPGNASDIPEAGDTAINNGVIVGTGTIAAALINDGTVEVSNNSAPVSSTGGSLDIQGAVSGIGAMTIDAGATLQLNGSLGVGQSIVFATGAPETLILGSPSGTIANPITGFAEGDKIEFFNGVTINSTTVLNASTLAITYHNAAGSIGVYDFTNVSFAPGTTLSFLAGFDSLTTLPFVESTRFITWTGTADTDFSNGGNWSGDSAPGPLDYAIFNNGTGDTISGIGSAAFLLFENTGTWSLAAGTTLTATTDLTLAGGGGGIATLGALTIGTGSTILTTEAFTNVGYDAGDIADLTVGGGGVLRQTAALNAIDYQMYIGASPASGTLAAANGNVLVTGTGSVIDLPFNGIGIGESGGSGTLTVQDGGAVVATSLNSNINDSIAIGRQGAGTLTITGPGSEVTVTGIGYVSHSANGTLSVTNGGTFLALLDPMGLGGLIVGDGSTNGVGGTGAATIGGNGLLESQGDVIVGSRGTQGQLTVQNTGTVQIGTSLTVGDGGTIAVGVTEAGNGTLTIDADGTVELTGTAQTVNYGVNVANSNIGTASTESAVVTVTGAAALLNANGNGIAVAQYGTGDMVVSQGGSVASGTPNSNLISALAVGRQGDGTVTVTDPGSRLTALGGSYIGKTGTGTLTVENSGSVMIGLDGFGTGDLSIGGSGTNSTGSLWVGGTGAATVTSSGNLYSQANIDVGNDGASGSLEVSAGGTTEAGGKLLIGDSTTLSSGAVLISATGTTNVTTTTVETGAGSVTVGAGGLLRVDGLGITAAGTAAVVVGAGAGSTATLNVTGVDAVLNTEGNHISVGGVGQGALLVSQGGTVLTGTKFTADGAFNIGVTAGVAGTVTVTDPGSTLDAVGQIDVGLAGTGSLTIENQGSVLSGASTLAPTQGVDIGEQAGSTGAITVTGTHSQLSNTGQFIVGDAGLGGLSILSGGTVVTNPGTVGGLAGLVIANTAAAADSSVDVTGGSSALNVTGLLDVGAVGSGVLTIGDGATVTAGSLDAANIASAVAQLDLSGAGTELSVTNSATVADDGTGVLSVLSGATFSASSLTIGSQGDSSGAVVVSGSGSQLNLSGALNIGTANGTGDLTVGPGAAIQAQAVFEQGQVVLEGGLLDPTVQLINQGQTAGGFGTIAAGDIVDEGAIQAGGNKGSQKLLIVQGTVLGGGTLTVNGTQPGSVPAGILQINAGGTLELSGAVLNAATTTFTDNLTPQGTYTVNNSVIDVNFVDDAGVLLLDDIAGFAGTIATYQAGDRFVITGGTLSGVIVSNGDTLLVSDSGANAGPDGIDPIIFNGPVNPLGFKVVNGNTVEAQALPCFAERTLIETERGPVAVEHLRVGDRAIARDGESRATAEPIIWIGERLVNCDWYPRPTTVWPVRVRAGTFAEDVPARDLYLSPDHAVFVNGVLVPVKLLIDRVNITQVKRRRIRYFHVELAHHAVILAEGMPVESYLDAGDRANFTGGDAIRLHPVFAPNAQVWETRGAAPLVMAGEALAAARAAVGGAVATRERQAVRSR